MNPNVMVAAITADGPVAIAITTLLLKHRAFSSIEHRLEVIEGGLKEFSANWRGLKPISSG